MADVMAALPLSVYFSLPKLILMLALVTPWLYLAPWVDKDAKAVKAPRTAWNLAVLGVGMFGVALWLVLPLYFLSLFIYLMLTAAVLIAYVVYRNGRVAAEARILTLDFIKKKLSGGPKTVSFVSRLKIYNPDGKAVHPPGADADPAEQKAYNMAQELLYDIVWRRASEADLTPSGHQARLRFVVDGVILDRPSMDLGDSEALIQYLKSVARLDTEDRRRPQQGNFSVDLVGKPMDMILRCAGTTGGQRMQIRVAQEYVRTKLDTLGMSQQVLERVRSMNKASNGLIIVSGRPGSGIVSGRPGSGVTSTLYSLLSAHDGFIQQLETLEQKQAISLENVSQHTYKDASKLAQLVASALRRDPEVLMIDQCKDTATAEVIARGALEWVRLCGDAELAVRPLRGILCQMLLRKLCPNCKEAYRPDPNMLSKANLPAKSIDKFYRPPTAPPTDKKGNPIPCPTCQSTGYLDRTAAFELLEVTDEMAELITQGATISQIKAACRKNKMLYLQEQALQKVIEGITSVQEVIRVSRADRKKR